MQAGGRVVSTVGAIPLGVGKGVGKGVFYGGKGIIHGVGFAGRKVGLVKKRDKHGNEVMVPATSDDERQMAGNISESEPETSFSGARGFGSPEPSGTTVPLPQEDVRRVASINESHAESVNITCVKATLNTTGTHDLKPYVQISLGRKAYKTGHAKQAAEPEWCVKCKKAANTNTDQYCALSGTKRSNSRWRRENTISLSRYSTTRLSARTERSARHSSM